jgi:DNA-binding XRE family transcriptional regulator
MHRSAWNSNSRKSAQLRTHTGRYSYVLNREILLFIHKNIIIHSHSIMVPRRGRLSGPGLIRGSGPLINRSTMMPGPIALKLRLLREERGLTHREAAKLANVSHWTLMRLESGERPPYMPTVTKIARAYGVSVEELVEQE